MIGPRFGRYQEAYLFGKLGHDLADRSGLLTTKSVVFTLFGQHVVFWTRHYRETYPYTRAGFSAAVESGNLNNACFNCIWAALFPLLSGEPLEDVLHEVEERLGFVRRAGYAFPHGALLGVHAMIQTLRGRPVRFSMLDGSELDPPAFEAQLEEGDLERVRALYYSLKAQALFVLGSPREALAAATRAIAEHPSGVRAARAHRRELLLSRALARGPLQRAARESAAVPAAGAPRRAPRVRAAARRVGQELPRQLPPQARPGPRRDRPAPRAGAGGHPALRAGHLARRGRAASSSTRPSPASSPRGSTARAASPRPPTPTCEKARAGYFRWGAHAKVEQLDQRYPYLAPRKPIAPTVTFAVRAEQFDVLSVVKASQSISGELKLPRLLETLLRIVVEHAGAEEGCRAPGPG